MKSRIAYYGLLFVLLAAVSSVDAKIAATVNVTTTAAANTTTEAANTTTAAANTTTAAAHTTAPTPTATQPPDDTFRVKNEKNETCLLAKFGIQFKILYTTTANTTKTASVDIPPDATVDDDKSKCEEKTATLALKFPNTNYSFTLDFVKDKETYYANVTTFQFPLDEIHFPNASKQGQVMSVGTTQHLFEASHNKSYSCQADQLYNLTDGKGVIRTHDVQLQAFDVKDDRFSTADVCSADSNSTVAPATTAPVTTSPPPTPPSVGNWTVKDENGTICMAMEMAIEFQIFYMDKDNKNQSISIEVNPDTVDTSSSDCSNPDISIFTLVFDDWAGWNMSMKFNKTKGSPKKYQLNKVILNYNYNELFKNPLNPGADAMSQSSGTDFSVSLGYSYKCDAQQNYTLINNTVVMLSDVRIQPFSKDVPKGKGDLGEAEDCLADQKTSNIVPIAVGCALAGLVIIVLIAYLIGRRRSHAKGYQSV